MAEIARHLLAAVRQRPGRARVRAPAELRGRRRAALAVGREGRADARAGRRGSASRRASRRRSRGCANERSVADAQRADHRDHGPGRLVPRRAAAREGLRGPRHGAPRVDREVRPHRASARPHHAPPGRPARPALAGRRAARRQAGRGLQPRGDVVRRRVLDPADADGRVHRRRRHADARGGARGVPGGALLPGLVERDVRQGARDAADRDDAVLPALAVRRGEGLRAPHHGQLPRVLRPLRARPGSSSTTSASAADSSSSRARSPGTRRRSSSGSATSWRSATSTPSATGATPRTTSRRCG